MNQKPDLKLIFWVNTGSLQVPVNAPNSANTNYGAFTGSTFSNTCPFTVNLISGASGGATGGFTANTTYLAANLTIAKPITTTSDEST